MEVIVDAGGLNPNSLNQKASRALPAGLAMSPLDAILIPMIVGMTPWSSVFAMAAAEGY